MEAVLIGASVIDSKVGSGVSPKVGFGVSPTGSGVIFIRVGIGVGRGTGAETGCICH